MFAFNASGVKYDAKNLDRTWDSAWDVKVRRTDAGWDAVASMPLSTFGFEHGKPTSFRWFATRETAGKQGDPEATSYKGLPLYFRNFPIVIE